MAQGQDFDTPRIADDAIEGDVTAAAMADHQLAQRSADRPPDVRVAIEHIDCIEDEQEDVLRRRRTLLAQEIGDPFEVGQSAFGEDNDRHAADLRLRWRLAAALRPSYGRPTRAPAAYPFNDVRANVLGGEKRTTRIDGARGRLAVRQE